MKKYGLIGFPLEHSLSKKFFEEKFLKEHITGCSYQLFPLPFIENFLPLLAAYPELKGLNVTIPYKETVMQLLNEVDDTAKAIGAVNCIKLSGNYLKGYNTDALAFEQSLKIFLTVVPLQAFVLGTGGSSKAVCFVLKNMGIPYLLVSRQPREHNIGYGDVEKNMKQGNLFVNTTPLGMFPSVETLPDIPYSKLNENDYLFDLVYNPAETLFLKTGKQNCAKTKNGLEMLRLQAEKSWEIWNGNE